MKSYIQGMITGGVLVFAMIVFIGAKDNDKQIGRYQMAIYPGQDGGTIYGLIDTINGQRYKHNILGNSWTKTGKPIQ